MFGLDVKTLITGAIALIALFVIVANGPNFARITQALAGGASTLIVALQGRNVSGFGTLAA
jgi:hypothetical protein